jgi:deazaflavin-dependent oxidoreductase (nitroreductase family)
MSDPTRQPPRPQPTAGARARGRLHRHYRAFVQRLGHTRGFAFALRQLGGARLDAWLYRHSRGRVSIAGPALFPVLLLTTTGRRSGHPRTTPVIYARDGDNLIVASEHFGQQRPAAWPLNLLADPAATVQLGAVSARVRARRASPEEIERHWPALLAAWPAHETYHQRSRARHVFVLQPMTPTAGRRAAPGPPQTGRRAPS